MSLLVFALLVLIAVAIVCAIAYQLPLPPGLIWLRWLIPCCALLIALVLVLQKLGV